MKIKPVFFLLLGFILLAYLYTLILVNVSMQRIIESDMQLLSGILYSANIISLDAEQNIEEKYANRLYEAAILADKDPQVLRVTDIDAGFVERKGKIMALTGERFIDLLIQCTDTINVLPRALLCKGFYIYVYPSQGGRVVVAIRKSRVDREKEKIGLNRLFNELSKIGVFFYIVLQNDSGVVYSTVDPHLFEGFSTDTVLRSVYINGQEVVRKRRFLTKKVIETILPFSYGDFRGIMRIGISAESYESLRNRVYGEVSVLFFMLFLALIFTFLLLVRARRAEVGYAVLKEVLANATVPVFLKNKNQIFPVNSRAKAIPLKKEELRDGKVVVINDTRYLVKSLETEHGEYLILISLELEDMKKRLTEYEAISNLIAEVAHEIKNPLNGISIIVQTLLAEEEREEYRDMLKQVSRIEESINRFVSLISPLRLKKECISQREIIKEALGDTGIDRVRKVEIQGDVRLFCDRAKVKEAYVNILKNAYEATGKQDTIKVIIENNYIVFENGGEIEETELVHIFEPFYTTKQRGTGIGMYYVKKVIEAHGWKIKVKSFKGKVEVVIEFNEGARC